MVTHATTLERAEGAGTGRWRLLLEDALAHPDTRAYRVTMRVIISLIFLSLAVLSVETVEELYIPYQPLLDGLEIIILAAFTLDYLAHIYVAPNRRAYIFSWWGIVDLLAILPSYLGLLQVQGVKFLRELRVLRVLRMLKLMKVAAERAHSAQERISHRQSALVLDIQIYLISVFTVVIIASTLVYHAERSMLDTKFTSIPAAMWWGFVTITTTGYGDMVPVTLWGRLVAAATMLSGLALFGMLMSVMGRALLTTLLGAGPGEDTGPRRRTGAAVVAAAHGVAGMAAAAVAAIPTPPRLGRAAGAADAATAPAAAMEERPTGAFTRTGLGTRQVDAKSPLFARLLYAIFVEHPGWVDEAVNITITGLVVLSVALVTLETVPSLQQEYGTLFTVLEYVILVAFTVEYLAHLYLAEHRWKYVFSFWGIIDLLAIVPSFFAVVAHLGALNLTEIRIVRILRVLRVLKLSRVATSRAQSTVRRRVHTFWLDLQIYLIALFSAVCIASTLVYHAEHEVNGAVFTDIPASMWWAIVTITTSGYGDMAPVTFAGRVVAVATMFTGLALFGILTSVIGRAMMSSLFGASDEDGDGQIDRPERPDDQPPGVLGTAVPPVTGGSRS